MRTSKNIGWICPKCDIAIAPSEKTCPACVASGDGKWVVDKTPAPPRPRPDRGPVQRPVKAPRIEIQTPPDPPGAPPKIYGGSWHGHCGAPIA